MKRHQLKALQMLVTSWLLVIGGQCNAKTKVQSPQAKPFVLTYELPFDGQAKFTCPPGWTIRNEVDSPVQHLPLERGFMLVTTRLSLVSGPSANRYPSADIELELDISCDTTSRMTEFSKSVLDNWKERMRSFASDGGSKSSAEAKFTDKKVTLKRTSGATYETNLHLCSLKQNGIWWTYCLLVATGDRVKLDASKGYYDNLFIYPIYVIEVSSTKLMWDKAGGGIEKTLCGFSAP